MLIIDVNWNHIFSKHLFLKVSSRVYFIWFRKNYTPPMVNKLFFYYIYFSNNETVLNDTILTVINWKSKWKKIILINKPKT